MANENSTIVRIKFGSHLYGTSTPTSDSDYKSVFIPSKSDILMQRVPGSIKYGPDKVGEGVKNAPGDLDEEAYSFARYLDLLMEGQTVALDMIFAPPQNILEQRPPWRMLQHYKDRFITKQSASFLGYCRQQANKYGIKGSRVLAAEVCTNAFEGIKDGHLSKTTHRRVGDWAGALEQIVREHPEHLDIVTKETTPLKFETYFVCCGRQIPYTAPVRVGWETCKRVRDEYGDRAQQAKENKGIDWKALSHAVRVGTEAIELLRTGHITLPCPNAAHLIDIKTGKLDYQPVSEEIEQLLEQVEAEAKVSTLREEPDRDLARTLVYAAHESSVKEC